MKYSTSETARPSPGWASRCHRNSGAENAGPKRSYTSGSTARRPCPPDAQAAQPAARAADWARHVAEMDWAAHAAEMAKLWPKA